MSLEAAFKKAGQQIGLNERDQRVALKEYLANGGVNLDPATTAWCAAYVNATLQQTGMKGTGSNMARSFMNWGQETKQPKVGDLAVFSRGDPNGPYGHVGFFQGYDDAGNILVLGGNQGDAVSVAPYSPDRLLGFRTSGEASGMPQNTFAALAPSQNALAVPMQQQRQDPRVNALAIMQAAEALAPRFNALDPEMFMTRLPYGT